MASYPSMVDARFYSRDALRILRRWIAHRQDPRGAIVRSIFADAGDGPSFHDSVVETTVVRATDIELALRSLRPATRQTCLYAALHVPDRIVARVQDCCVRTAISRRHRALEALARELAGRKILQDYL